MEMSIAAMSMGIVASKTQQQLSIGMLKKDMEAAEQTGKFISDMIANMPSPDGRGRLLNVRV